ncbi:MAG: hypothetical protein K9H65_03630 [Bacteroidales bacterium]|nr:hypothetical protein [Bacteroidales bacterium]
MKNQKLIHLVLILLGLAGAIFSQYYSGFGAEIMQNYGANFFFPFAIYFIIRKFPLQIYTVTLIAIGGVCLQELAQLWGLYSGIFDYKDLIVDLAGVFVALAIDRRLISQKAKKGHSVHE